MTTCLRSDIKTRSRRPGADEHHEDLRVIPQPLILPASAARLHGVLTRPFGSLKIISLSFQRVRAAFPLRIALWVLACGGRDLRGLWSFVPLGHGLLLTLIAAWFTCRAWFSRYFVYERKPGRGLAAAFVGPVWGYGAEQHRPAGDVDGWYARSGAADRAAAGGGDPGSLCRDAARHARTAGVPGADVVAVSILIILTAGIVVRPFSRVASPLPDGGRAYRAYFTADFIWRMAVAAELAKGDVPPVNPFHRNDYLHYYWLPHLLPAAEYREMRGAVSLEQILLANSVALDVTFVMFLYGFCRQWVRSPTALTAACAATLLVFELRRHRAPVLPVEGWRAAGFAAHAQHRRDEPMDLPEPARGRPAPRAVVPAAPRDRLCARIVGDARPGAGARAGRRRASSRSVACCSRSVCCSARSPRSC